jgi:uncharacterized protein (TIGR02145 family)
MKTKSLLTGAVFFFIASVFGQKPTIELTFTAIDSTTYVQLDSIKVMNRTQGGDNVLYWPDTTLTLGITPGDLLLCIGYSTGYYPVGLQEIHPKTEEFTLFQNYPNPVQDQSIISMFIPEKGIVNVMVTDVQGKLIFSSDWQLDKGNHLFSFMPGDGSLFFLTARWNGVSRSIKILMSEPTSGKQCMLDYIGRGNGEPLFKAALLRSGFMQESGILDAPFTNKTYTFQFATNIPCPGTPTVTYEGQVYNTIQIFSQCWLKENLNVGTMIIGTQNMINNSVIEKYCYNNKVDSCTKYGGLYQWDEMMQYNLQQGVQGICPSGWHLPMDEEWMVLEGAVDSHYGIGEPEWDMYDDRGFDAGTNLKSLSGWFSEGNGTDLFGFSGLPGGYRDGIGFFFGYIRHNGYWWTSTEYTYGNVWNRKLKYINPGIYRLLNTKGNGYSVRCLKDY